MLVFDKATTYINEEIIKFLNDNKILYVIIPAGFTRFLQPLDVSINRPFKMTLKKYYLNFQQNNLDAIMNNKFFVKDEDILNMIHKIWYNEEDIKKTVIINSFLVYDISQNLDGTQDDLFRWPELYYDINNKTDISFIINDLDISEDDKNEYI